MKYVIIENKMPILFGVDGNHDDIEKLKLGKVTSAGFVLLESTGSSFKLKTYGRSASLNIGPSSEDSNIIYRHLAIEYPNVHGMKK